MTLVLRPSGFACAATAGPAIFSQLPKTAANTRASPQPSRSSSDAIPSWTRRGSIASPLAAAPPCPTLLASLPWVRPRAHSPSTSTALSEVRSRQLQRPNIHYLIHTNSFWESIRRRQERLPNGHRLL